MGVEQSAPVPQVVGIDASVSCSSVAPVTTAAVVLTDCGRVSQPVGFDDTSSSSSFSFSFVSSSACVCLTLLFLIFVIII